MTEMLSKTEKLIYDYIANRGANTDIPIKQIYFAVYKHLPVDETRNAQQTIGAFISRINAKLEGAEIRPGKMKQTYRLKPKKTRHHKAA